MGAHGGKFVIEKGEEALENLSKHHKISDLKWSFHWKVESYDPPMFHIMICVVNIELNTLQI